MNGLPDGWALEPLIKHITSKSGDSKIIKGKQSSKPQAGLFQGFSASGPDVWVPEAHYQGKGIVVSAVGARCGKSFQAEGKWTAIANTHVLVPSRECRVDFKWLWYLTNDEDFWIRSGTAQPFVKVKDTLLRLQLIPPLEEQIRIVEALDDHLSRLDKALAELNDGLSASDVFARSLLKAAFEGKLTRSEETDWKPARIGDVADFAPKKPNHLKASKEECSFIPMAAVQEVTGAIDLSQRISHEKALSKTLTFFNEGDVLFAKVTPCMENGKIAVARGLTNRMGYGSTEFHVLSPRAELLADYLRYFLVSKDFRVNAASAMTGAVGLRRVPKSYLEERRIPLPSLHDQQLVVDALDFQLSILDRLKESMHDHISRISKLRRSLLHAAFTGELG